MEALKAGDRVIVRPGMDRDRGVMTLRVQRADGQWSCANDHGDVFWYGAHALTRVSGPFPAKREG